ncbi:MAG: hypothetical protein AAB431_03120 [Patescibacteria group bacterium]
MMLFFDILLIALHAFIAWLLVEVFVNNAHSFSRKKFIFFHYLCVIATFAIIFAIYFSFFSTFSVFATAVIAICVVGFLELLVFGYLYSGDRWFLNYVDWIFPMFLAVSTVYFVGKFFV